MAADRPRWPLFALRGQAAERDSLGLYPMMAPDRPPSPLIPWGDCGGTQVGGIMAPARRACGAASAPARGRTPLPSWVPPIRGASPPPWTWPAVPGRSSSGGRRDHVVSGQRSVPIPRSMGPIGGHGSSIPMAPDDPDTPRVHKRVCPRQCGAFRTDQKNFCTFHVRPCVCRTLLIGRQPSP